MDSEQNSEKKLSIEEILSKKGPLTTEEKQELNREIRRLKRKAEDYKRRGGKSKKTIAKENVLDAGMLIFILAFIFFYIKFS